MNDNIILLTDSYKFSHFNLDPQGTHRKFDYLESRGGLFPEVTFFGLQYILMKYLAGPVVTKEKIDEAEDLILGGGHGTPFNRKGWEYILNNYGGYLPVHIKAVPEGTTVPVKNVLMTCVNTDNETPWLTGYLEGLLQQVWYPTTTCTISKNARRVISKWMKKTSGSDEGVGFKLQDFGFRGASSVESASLGGAGHLVNFLGTDTVPALRLLRDYYGAKKVSGYSIPATEHSVITIWGEDGECTAFENFLDKYPTGIIACVSDSWNIFRACSDYWGDRLRSKILSRQGTLVVRPDSGDPLQVLPEIMDILATKFGFTVNDQGYKVLPPQIRVIQGDGVDLDSLEDICSTLAGLGYSIENIAFGMGGALLQKCDRDTQKFAIKCSAAYVEGKWIDVWKSPLHDKGKESKKGVLDLIKVDGEFKTVQTNMPGLWPGHQPQLQEVFHNGNLYNIQSLDEIRERAQTEWI